MDGNWRLGLRGIKGWQRTGNVSTTGRDQNRRKSVSSVPPPPFGHFLHCVCLLAPPQGLGWLSEGRRSLVGSLVSQTVCALTALPCAYFIHTTMTTYKVDISLTVCPLMP